MMIFWVMLGISLLILFTLVGLGAFVLMLAKAESAKAIAYAMIQEIEQEGDEASAFSGIGFRN